MTERIRGRALQERNRRLSEIEPLCRMCLAQGRIRAGTVTDHIVALVNGGSDTDDNLQRLCDDCHEQKTRRDLGQHERPMIGADGWPIDQQQEH